MPLSLVGSVTHATALGSGFGIVVQGDYAYVAGETADALAVVDLSTPSAPSIAGFVTHATNLNIAAGVAVDGDYAYVAVRNLVTVVDVSNPASPSIAATVAVSGRNTGLVKIGDHVFVANTLASSTVIGITAVDVSTPTSPSVAGTLTSVTITGAYWLAEYGGYLVVASSTNLAVVDVSNPAAMSVTGSVGHGATASTSGRGLSIVGDVAAMTGFADDSLALLDLTTPTAPTLTSRVTSATRLDGAHGVVTSGGYALAAAQIDDGVSVWDISDPSTFTTADNVDWLAPGSANGVRGLAIYGTYLIGASAADVFVLDASDYITLPPGAASWRLGSVSFG